MSMTIEDQLKQLQDRAQALAQTKPFDDVAREQKSAIEKDILSTMLEGREMGALFSILSLIPVNMTHPDPEFMGANCTDLFVNPYMAECLTPARKFTVLHHELVHIRNRHMTRTGKLLEIAKARANSRYVSLMKQWSNVFLDIWCDGEVVSARHVKSDHQFAMDHLQMVTKHVQDKLDAIYDETSALWPDAAKLGDQRADEITLLNSFINFLIDNSDEEDDGTEADGPVNIGGFSITEEDVEIQEAKLNATLMAAARQAGIEPGHWGIELPNPDTRPLICDIIKQVADDGNTKWSGAKIDQEMAQAGFILPTKCMADNLPIAVMLDISGSVVWSPAEFAYLLGQLEQLNEETPVMILPFDHDVKPIVWCEEEDAIDAYKKRGPKGGGGTSFDAPVKAMNDIEGEFSALVMLTDGEACYTKGLSDRQITWISTSSDTRRLDPEGDHYLCRV